MSGSDWFGLCWLLLGIPGGIAFAWTNRHQDVGAFDRALTLMFSFLVGVLMGPLSLPGIGELHITVRGRER